MRIIKPKRIKHGDVIGICAPASPPASAEKLNKGIAYLERCGFRVETGKNIFKKRGYLAGNDNQRAEDLNKLFANPKVKAIFTIRGGYGSQRILPLLDYKLIRRNPKILVGYSDITALHFALLSQAGMVSFSGPMVAVEMSDGLNSNVEERFWNMLMSTDPPPPMKGGSSQLSIVHREKTTSGRLLGGNLSLVSALAGTSYFPSVSNTILLLEEVDERPYRVDRMIQQLKLAGILPKLKGLALGDFSSCRTEKSKPSLSVPQIFDEACQKNKIPLVQGFQYGHMKSSNPFPVGVKVRLNRDKNILEFLESGVC